MRDRRQVLDDIVEGGVVAVLRASDADRAVVAGGALIEAGVRSIEVTFTVPGAPSVIAELRARHGDRAVIGAGTVTSPEHVDAAIGAGAEFLVAPGHRDEVTEAAVRSGAVTMIGAFTAGEVMAVTASGADVVKFFPGGLAGPAGIKALRGPFPQARFVPTGGVSAHNLGEWFAAGAIAVGAGSELAPAAAVESGDVAAIDARAREFLAALDEVRRRG